MKFVVLGTGFPDIIQTIEDVLLVDKSMEFIGFLDDDESKSKKKFFGYEVLGPLDWLNSNLEIYSINTIARNLQSKANITKKLKTKNIKFVNLIHPSVNIKFAEIGNEGILISKNVYLEATSKISSHTMILHGTSIGHDCEIGENAFVGFGCNLLGNVKVGKNCLIGAGTTIYPGVQIADNSITGINSIIMSNVNEGETISSPPSRRIFS